MKSILVFCPYYPPHIGGLESHAKEFNEHLKKYCEKIVVFTPDLPKNLVGKTVENGIELIRFPAFELISNWPFPKFWQSRFWKLYFGLDNQNFDIVISRTRFFMTSLMALMFSKVKKVKWIHIEHGSDFIRLENRWKSALAWIYDQTFGRAVFKFSDENVSISNAVDGFVEKFDKRKRNVIYRGIDFGEIDKISVDTKIKKKYKNKIIVSFVGRLYKWKGVENSIKAVKLLPNNLRNKIIFLIVGGGEDQNRLEKMALGFDNIKFLGSVDRDRAISILKTSDIFIHSSLAGGGLSTSLLEAIYCKNIVLATANEGAGELNIKSYILASSSTDLILNGLVEILNNIERYKENLEYNKKYISDNFTWDKSIPKYEKIFN